MSNTFVSDERSRLGYAVAHGKPGGPAGRREALPDREGLRAHHGARHSGGLGREPGRHRLPLRLQGRPDEPGRLRVGRRVGRPAPALPGRPGRPGRGTAAALRVDPGTGDGVLRRPGTRALGLAELFLGTDPAQDPEQARLAGSVPHAMFIGVMVKWFMDPKQALPARELADGLRIIAEHITGQDRADT